MSNIIKLQRVVGRVQIEHSFGNLRGMSSSRAAHADSEECQFGRGDDSSKALLDEYHRGIEAGRAEATKELSVHFEGRLGDEHARVEAFLTSVRSQLLALHQQWEQSVMQFAFSVAQLIVKREVSIDKEIVLGQVREALRHLVGAENVKLRVHPRDEEIVRHRRADVFSISDSLRDMIIEADDKIEPGGCIVESELGNVDARLSTQLKSLEARLFEQKTREVQS